MSTELMDDRGALLDAFSQMKRDTGGTNAPATVTHQAPVERVFGAQKVAVKRDEEEILRKLRVLANAAGDDWYYRYPVKNKRTGQTDWIEGPSIKLANDIARLYGNCDVDCRVQDMGDVWLFLGRFQDLETGFSLTRPFQSRKSASTLGGEDDARRADISFQIGASKAIRNVVVNALQTFADYAFEEAKGALIKKIGSEVDKWREKIADRVGAHVDLRRVEAAVGRTKAEWLAGDIAKIFAMAKAVSDGMATWDETFPPLKGDRPEKPAASKVDAFAADKPKAVEPQRAKQDAKAPPAEEPTKEQAPAEDGKVRGHTLEVAMADEHPGVKLKGDADDETKARNFAYHRGGEAKRAGMSRRAMPGEYRAEGKSHLVEAWYAGYDAAPAPEPKPERD